MKQYIRLSKDGEMIMNEAFISIEGDFLNRIQAASKEDIEDIEHAIDILHQNYFIKLYQTLLSIKAAN